MKLVSQIIVLLFLCLEMQAKGVPVKHFTHPERIRYDGSCMTIDGTDFFIYSAALDYFRCPEELWRDRFKKIKEDLTLWRLMFLGIGTKGKCR